MRKGFFRLLIIVLFLVGAFQLWKPLPDGIRVEGSVRYVPESSVAFFSDTTYVDETGVRYSNQAVFNEVFRMIKNAEEYILLDFFLYNSFQGESAETTRALSGELTTLLLGKKREHPSMDITLVTDPINEVYGGFVSPEFTMLKEAGISVITTDLKKLRDSNPIYSSIWRTFIEWFGNKAKEGIVSHPFSNTAHKVTVRSWLDLFNFKANHRKLVVADLRGADGTRILSTLVTSGNPHDASSAHGNVAVRVDGLIGKDFISSEQAVAAFSQGIVPDYAATIPESAGPVGAQILTEGKIREKLLELLGNAGEGDAIDIVMFYLADRGVVNALLGASGRGAAVRLILDPNRDAFGHQKIGIPNRQAAHELRKESGGKIDIRWCDTHGEQCHSKLILMRYGGEAEGEYAMMLGSANLTRRNIGDYNLETDILVTSPTRIPAIGDAYEYVDQMWNNRDGKVYTKEYAAFEETGTLKWILYWIQEQMGLSSF